MKTAAVAIALLQCTSLLVSGSLHDETDTDLEAGFLRGRELGETDEFATCNGCFCVPDEGSNCPIEARPNTDWSSLIPTLRSFELSNPPSLDCDPYCEECDPPSLQQDGVCVVEIEPSSSTCPDGYKYSLKTFDATAAQSLPDNQYITHSNPCGVCSTLQDLAVYMGQGAQLRNVAQNCGIKGILGKQAGTNCFMDLGFTEACATMWHYNAVNTRKKCRWSCWAFYLFDKEPNTGPQCDLATCIDCDERESGPLFDIFAGRTRRNSGLLSNIVRKCSEMQVMSQADPCSLN